MAKPRVHELAKELDPTGKKITSKMILAWFKDQGEFVKAASSAVEPPVARRVREHFAAKPGGTAGGRGKDGAKPGPRRPSAPGPKAPAAAGAPAHPAPKPKAPAPKGGPKPKAPAPRDGSAPRTPKGGPAPKAPTPRAPAPRTGPTPGEDRKSTRLNSSH